MRLLFICSDLRPGAGAASFRARAFKRYLTEFGWEVTCASHEAEVPAAEVGQSAECSQAETRFIRGIKRLVNPYYPYDKWLKYTSPVVSSQGERTLFDAILVTTPPHQLHRPAMQISVQLGIPYIADLRDDWITNHRTRYLTPIHRWMSNRDERECVEVADKVILNTDLVYERFVSRYPSMENKFIVICNGYEDYVDCSSISEAKPADGMRIVYAGDPYNGFMENQLQKLAVDIRNSGQNIKIVTLGGGWRSEGCPPLWEHLGNLSPSAAAAQMVRADVLLLAMPPGEKSPSATVPLKAYSYLRSGRSIVYLGEAGSTTVLLEKFAGTYCLGRQGWAGLASWLVLNMKKLKVYHHRPGIEEFHIREKSKLLTYALLDVINARASSPSR
jgi:hypothetical protein